MATTADFRNGMVLEIDGQLSQIVYFQHVKPGKGGAFVRSKLKNVLTGAVVDRTWTAGERVTEVRLERRPVQYSYNDGQLYHFMDLETYDDIPLSADLIGDLVLDDPVELVIVAPGCLTPLEDGGSFEAADRFHVDRHLAGRLCQDIVLDDGAHAGGRELDLVVQELGRARIGVTLLEGRHHVPPVQGSYVGIPLAADVAVGHVDVEPPVPVEITDGAAPGPSRFVRAQLGRPVFELAIFVYQHRVAPGNTRSRT